MKFLKKKRIFIYITFIVVAIAAVTMILISKLNTNILVGKWLSSDGQREYLFDNNTITLTYTDVSYSELYGYNIKDNSILIIQKGNSTEYYQIKIQGEQIAFYSENSDSPEILNRVYE